MSCGCENRRRAGEIDRMRRLAKAWARMEGKTAVILRKPDGTYDIGAASEPGEKHIVEYITPY